MVYSLMTAARTFAAACIVLSGVVVLADGPPKRPNILFLMTDQHRWDCVGANGNALIQTPNLDRLASEGANFTHCFVQAPVCVPSRVSFFTGRYPHSHRNRVNYTPLDRGEVLMPAAAARRGVRHGVGWQTALLPAGT